MVDGLRPEDMEDAAFVPSAIGSSLVVDVSLAEALESRKLIERAKGMLMAREKITEEEAYGRIRRASQKTGKPMRTIAEAVIETMGTQAGT